MKFGSLFLLDDSPAVFIEVECLHLHEVNAGHMVFAGDALEGLARMDYNALFLSLLDLFIVRSHLLTRFQTCQMDALCSETYGRSCAVKRDVAAAKDDHMLAHAGLFAHGAVTQEVRVQKYSGKIVAGHSETDAHGTADSHQHCVIIIEQLCRLRDLDAALNLNALLLDDLYFLSDDVSRKAVRRDSVSGGSACGGHCFLDRYVMALLAQIVGSRQAGRSGSDNTYLLAGVRQLFGSCSPLMFDILIRSIALDQTDGHRV